MPTEVQQTRTLVRSIGDGWRLDSAILNNQDSTRFLDKYHMRNMPMDFSNYDREVMRGSIGSDCVELQGLEPTYTRATFDTLNYTVKTTGSAITTWQDVANVAVKMIFTSTFTDKSTGSIQYNAIFNSQRLRLVNFVFRPNNRLYLYFHYENDPAKKGYLVFRK